MSWPAFCFCAVVGIFTLLSAAAIAVMLVM